jgi:hypothetical protein
MDSKAIAESPQLLLTTGSRVENTGMVWDSEHTALLDWGGSPTLVEPVKGTITLRGIQGAHGVSVQAIDGAGQPLGVPVPATASGVNWKIEVGSITTTWYQITVVR